MREVEAAGGLSIHGALAIPDAAQTRGELIVDGVPAKLAAKDPTLWGPDAEAEAKIRLGWMDTFRRSRDLLPRLAELRAEFRSAGLDRVVLAGMGGSSLAPEVISRTLGVDLTVLDTTDPHQVRAALADRLERTVVVVSSKSGGTVETDSHRRMFLEAFEQAGLPDPGRRFVVVTDPGSPLSDVGAQMGAHVILADPDVGGRYSALTAFGLVPTALAGVDVTELLDEAEAFAPSLARDSDNPALTLGATLGAAALAGRDKLAVATDGTGVVGLGDWIEQLVAESTGKQGRGILPVVLETPAAPAAGDEVMLATVGGALWPGAVPGGGARPDIAVNGPLGAQFLCWEFATAVAGRVIGFNPFDQPNVAESKENTQRILSTGFPEEPPVLDTAAALRDLLGKVRPGDYLAVMAYLDRFTDAQAAELRPRLAALTGRPVTFGWGPRFLHSTGQYHKGGPQRGVFLQLTGGVTDDLDVPGRPYTFGQLQAAQAAGDREALAGRGRPVLRLHLADRAQGITDLLAAVESLA